MDKVTLIELLAQAEDSEAGAAVESFLRLAARTAFTTVTPAEGNVFASLPIMDKVFSIDATDKKHL